MVQVIWDEPSCKTQAVCTQPAMGLCALRVRPELFVRYTAELGVTLALYTGVASRCVCGTAVAFCTKCQLLVSFVLACLLAHAGVQSDCRVFTHLLRCTPSWCAAVHLVAVSQCTSSVLIGADGTSCTASRARFFGRASAGLPPQGSIDTFDQECLQ